MPKQTNLGDERICVERPLAEEEDAHAEMLEDTHTKHHFNRLKAAFLVQKLWPKSVKEITFQFVDPATFTVAGKSYNNPPTPQWTPLKLLENVTNEKGEKIPMDPLEKELHDSTDLKEVVRRVLTERFQPILPFKIRIVDKGGDVRITFVGGAGCWSLVGTDCLRAPKNEATMNFGW